ncbi:MAG: dehypoxanthine futalosine cyclase [Desulfamplus sp.]|nr:dehypoxanthine futalosine cyclase [Desulfamplus sp.]
MDNLDTLVGKVCRGERINIKEAMTLYNDADLLALGYLADGIRFWHKPNRTVTFVVDRNINYTDICVSGCRFCAFYKTPESGDGYVITREELHHKIEETLELGGTQILLQGGLNPDIPLSYYLDMLGDIKENFQIHIHGFSPPEIAYIAEISKLSIQETISRLQEAGLDSIPGGGAEILSDDIRKMVSPGKCMTETWLKVMETAHGLGMATTATMMFGHLESLDHIFQHLDRIRSLQDRTGGFTAFIPWTFQPHNTRIGKKKATSAQYLRVLALSRIYLDNFDNIQASWVTQGEKIAQMALFYGANDMGSTMIEENVVASAGVHFMLPESELRRLIETAGFEAKQRDCFYNFI